MRYKEAARTFRERLVADVAMTPLARAWARGAAPPELPAMCGLDKSVLDEAAATLAQVTPLMRGRRNTYYSFSLPSKLNDEAQAVAEHLRWTRADLVRSLLHTVMQIDREPTKRPFRKWIASCEESEKFRKTLAPLRPKKTRSDAPNGATVRPDRAHLSFLARPGLYEAVKRRATAYGVPAGRYLALWISDLVDGLLADLVLDLITPEQTFEKVAEYRVPVLRSGR